MIDFSSNDYLGFAQSAQVFEHCSEILAAKNLHQNGATGSRLLSGNSSLLEETEIFIANFHQAESALLFNSGYMANLGFFSSVPQRGDIVFYDSLIHASIRDGLQMSLAKSYKFKHNDWRSIELPQKQQDFSGTIYLVTESVFSMDGDSPNLKALADFCTENKIRLVVDEAHAVGIFGEKGAGLVQKLQLQNRVFARINTFGKAIGCHGAVVLGGKDLMTYLINFSRPFIYTTAMSPHAAATILAAYSALSSEKTSQIQHKINFFRAEIKKHNLENRFILSHSAIQSCEISGNEAVKQVALKLQAKGFDVKPILSPTVPKGKERLRFCLHTYNSDAEIAEILSWLSTFVN